jgi:hypothetical protein
MALRGLVRRSEGAPICLSLLRARCFAVRPKQKPAEAGPAGLDAMV